MGQAPSTGIPWVDIGLTTGTVLASGAQAWDNHKTGKQKRKLMKEVEPIIRANANAITSYLGHRRVIDRWSIFVSGLGVAAQLLEVWQGSRAQAALEEIGARIADNAEAQTGLIAPKKFAEQVHHFISQQTTRERPSKRRLHVFFLYHPDTDWDPAFFHRIQGHNGAHPLSHRFLGMSENLDALVVWMRFMKENMAKEGKKIHIHLLIPAYRPMLIGEALAFPDQLMPLTIHGHIHNSKPYVWLNLPNPSRRLRLVDIGNLTDLPPDEAGDSTVGKVVIGVAATVAAGILAGPGAAAVVGGVFARDTIGSQSESRHPFISDADPRTLGEGPLEDSDDGGSSDNDEERQARRHEPAARRVRRRRRYRDIPRGH